MKKLILLVFFNTLFFLNIFSQELFKMEYSFNQGVTYRYKDVIKTKITQEMMGQEMRTDIKTEIIHKIVADTILENGNIIMTISFDSIKAQISSKQFDTNIVIKEIPSRRKKYEIDKYGNIISRNQKLKINLEGQQLTEQLLQDEFLFHIFDAKEFKPNDKWEKVVFDTIDVMNTQVVVKTKTKYKLLKKEKKFDRECLKVEYESEAESEGNVKIQGQDMYFESVVDAEGTFYYDLTDKLIIYEKGDVEDNTTLATTGPNTIMIPIIQRSSFERTLLK